MDERHLMDDSRPRRKQMAWQAAVAAWGSMHGVEDMGGDDAYYDACCNAISFVESFEHAWRAEYDHVFGGKDDD